MPPKICLYPALTGTGGPASFQKRLAAGLEERGVTITCDLNEDKLAAILVVGGTSSLPSLYQARQRGIRIIQRLNGMNWIHRRLYTGVRHFLRAEYGNLLLAFIRRHMAQSIVYQSHFSQEWWNRVWGIDREPTHIIHNAVNLGLFTPNGPEQPPDDRWRLLVVEGNLGGGYDWGLKVAVALANGLAEGLENSPQKLELVVAGSAKVDVQQTWQARCRVPMKFTGWLPREEIPALDRSAHLLYAADINPACPNSAIEAMACGLPVLAFDTGAMRELVTNASGRLIPYGGNAWKLETPDIPGLVRAAREILENQEALRVGARQHAEECFDLNDMVEAYTNVLMG